jgi:hypothetical protein
MTEYMVVKDFYNDQLLLQCVEHDLEEAEWHDGAGDQTTNCRLPLMLSQEPQFVQKPDVSQQQSPGKYLR